MSIWSKYQITTRMRRLQDIFCRVLSEHHHNIFIMLTGLTYLGNPPSLVDWALDWVQFSWILTSVLPLIGSGSVSLPWPVTHKSREKNKAWPVEFLIFNLRNCYLQSQLLFSFLNFIFIILYWGKGQWSPPPVPWPPLALYCMLHLLLTKAFLWSIDSNHYPRNQISEQLQHILGLFAYLFRWHLNTSFKVSCPIIKVILDYNKKV